MTLPTREDLARRSVLRALSAYDGKARTGPLPDVLVSNRLDELPHERIVDGVIAFCLAAGTSGGSVGQVNLYTLVNAYLKDPACQGQINAVLQGYSIKH